MATWLDELLAVGDNATFFPQLVQQITEADLVPFVGAGLSAPYLLPQWGELIVELASDKVTQQEVKALLDNLKYEDAAEHVIAVKGPAVFQRIFRQKLDIAIDTSLASAVKALASFPRGPIITTNFDQVIEQVFEAEGCPPKVLIGDKPEKIGDAFQINANALLKIHGDLDDAADRVLAKEEYDRAYDAWLNTLLRNVSSRCLLFLGCSLKTDRPMQVLRGLVKARHMQTSHYAVLPCPADDEERRRRTRLLADEHRIFPIWYPSTRHDDVRRIVEHLAALVKPDRRRNSRTASALHNDLPQARFLFGRKTDQLVAALETARIVVVEGNRGVGKTVLALRALHEFSDRSTFGALVWTTAVPTTDQTEPLTLSRIFTEISKALDFPFRPLMTVPDKEAEVRKELEQRNVRCLLLIDNFETITDPEISRFLFDPSRLPSRLTVLITSTGQVTGPGVKPFPLDELDEPSAAAMFRQCLTDRGLPQESDAEVARLFRIVGGNPLAIEWVVGQMRDQGVQLAWELEALAVGKSSILERVFAKSWGLLAEDERALLAAITVFRRPALEASLHAASGLAEGAFRASLARLTRLYLVKRLRMEESPELTLTGRRYFIHPFTRDFLIGQRDATVTSEICRRTVEFYARFVPERGGTPEREEAAGIHELNAERENIFGVIDGCWSVGERRLVVPLMRAMCRWLFIESHWDDLERYGLEVVEDAVKVGDRHAAARILNEVGRTFSHRSDFKRAAAAFARAMELAQTEPADEWALAYIRHHAGEALMRERRLDEARPVLATSLEGFERIESTRSIIGVRYRMAMLAFQANDLPGARALATRGVEDTQVERWARLEGFNRRLLGDVARCSGEFDEARSQYDEALRLVPPTDMRIHAAIELSLAQLEDDAGNRSAGWTRAVVAQGHFEKLRMPKEADLARRLAAKLKPN